MRKIKIAQIGTSQYSHGDYIWNSLKKQDDIFEIAGYCMPENEKEKFPNNVKSFAGYREMTVDEILNDPSIEAVAIETEEKYLTKYALQAALHGKHIHMEKPGGSEMNTFEELIKAVKRNNTVFHLGYMYRYNPYIAELMQRIKNGELGEVYSVEAQMNCPESPEMRQWLSTYKGGMMFFLGCHLIDLVLQIMKKPENIIVLNRSTGIDGVVAEDFGMAVFEYNTGISFVKTCGCELGGYNRRQLIVTGSKGSVELEPLEVYDDDGLRTYKKECFSHGWDPKREESRSEKFDRYDGMMQSFAELVRGEKENPYTADYELELYKTILKCCGVEI